MLFIRFLKIFLKVFVLFTVSMLVANYFFIKTNFKTIIIISLVSSLLNAITVYKKENQVDNSDYR